MHQVLTTDYGTFNCIGERRPLKLGGRWNDRYSRSSDDAEPSIYEMETTIKESPDFALEALSEMTCDVPTVTDLMAAIREQDSTAIGDIVLTMISDYFAEKVNGDRSEWDLPETAETYAHLVELHDDYVASDKHSFQMATPKLAKAEAA